MQPRYLVLGTLGLLSLLACSTGCSSTQDDPGVEPGGDDGGVTYLPDGAIAPSCTDGKKNGVETDVDCGGSCSQKCGALKGCAGNPDCGSDLVCVKNVCAAVTATDGVKSGTETDVDCGGDLAPPCETGKACVAGKDCVDKICNGGVCAPPSPTDGVKNGKETDVDCGGGAPANPCADLLACKAGPDCASGVCTGDVCQAPGPNDGVKNGAETDVDCGGGVAARCLPTKACAEGPRDCDSFVCTGNVCQAPAPNDGVKNGSETDTDCGGPDGATPRCAANLSCAADGDCASDGCDYGKHCAVARSCTKEQGGHSCGPGEAAAGHESCCITSELTGMGSRIDKYHVTAGRMRAFIERVNGDVRTFAQGNVPGWDAGAWNDLVPSNVGEADKMLGPLWFGAPNDGDADTNAWSKRSCNPNTFGGHTYWTPASAGGTLSSFTQAQLDAKALNCVNWHLAKAFCAWDGGRLATRAEITNAFTNNGQHAHPWVWSDATTFTDAEGVQDPRLNHRFNYGFPGNNPPRNGGGTLLDIAWHVAAPGRFPLGANMNGVQDIAGNLLHYVNDAEYGWTSTLSWERHGKSLGLGNWKSSWPGEPNGYYAVGFRCARD